MVTDAREPSRGYHVPSTDNTISEDMARLILALTAVGVDVAGLLEDVAGKAAAVHGHQIVDIIGLADSLANKAAADHVHALGGLSDVDTAGAATFQVLAKSIDGKWRPWTIDLANATGGANYARLDGATFTGPTKVPTPSTAADSLNAVNVTSLRAFVSSAISALVASSPSTLDTLNELAAALGNDPNFAATITAALGNKAAKSTTITAGSGLTGGGDLSANRSLAIDFATPAETVAGQIVNKPAAPDGVHAAIAAALAGIPTGGARIKRIVQIAATANYTPSAGTTMAFVVLQGAGGGGAGGYAGNSATPGGGGAGAFAIALLNVEPGTSYPVIVGAGGGGGPANSGANGNPGGATTITIDGVVYSAGGGAAGVQNGAGAGGVPSGSFLEARAGLGGFTTSAGGQALTWMGGARRGDGGSGGGVNAGWAGLSGYVTIVEIGA